MFMIDPAVALALFMTLSSTLPIFSACYHETSQRISLYLATFPDRSERMVGYVHETWSVYGYALWFDWILFWMVEFALVDAGHPSYQVYIEKRIYRCTYDIHVFLGDDQIKCHKSWSNAKRSIIVLRVKRHVALHFKKYIQIIYISLQDNHFCLFCRMLFDGFVWDVSRLHTAEPVQDKEDCVSRRKKPEGHFFCSLSDVSQDQGNNYSFKCFNLFQPSNLGSRH